MQITIQEFSKLTTLMFAASLDQNKWSTFLEYLAGITDVRTHMFGFDVENSMNLDLLSSSYDPDFIKTFNEHYGDLNSWVPGLFQHSTGYAIPSESMCSREKLEKTEWYNDWVKPQEDILAGGGSILFKDNTRMFAIGGNIRRKDEHLEKEWLELVDLITPHLQSAIEINRVIAGKNINDIVSGEGLNTSSTATLIINNFSKIVFANELAQNLLDSGTIITSNHLNHLSFNEVDANNSFKRSIHSLNALNMDLSSKFACTDKQNASKYSCHTIRFDPRNHDISPFGLLVGVQEPCFLLTITEQRSKLTSVEKLKALYRLSTSESEIAQKIAEGMTLKEISENRQVSIHTVRNQLKSVMQKMGVHKQVDLVNLVREN